MADNESTTFGSDELTQPWSTDRPEFDTPPFIGYTRPEFGSPDESDDTFG